MNEAIIGLGSNINPAINIEKAIEIISRQYSLVRRSKLLQTKPIGFLEQDDFINCNLLIKTKNKLNELISGLKQIELELGREKTSIKDGPRVIDLDVIVYNGKIIDCDIYARDFLMDLTMELLPDLRLDSK